jgi:uncharacterized lipoprotein YajG
MNKLGIPLALAILCGCATTANKELWLKTAATVAYVAVNQGTLYELKTKPQSRVAFQVAEQALSKLLQDQNYSNVEFQKVLSQLPIKTFKGDQGALVTGLTVQVFELFTTTMFDINSAPAVKLIMTNVRDGLSSALNSTGSATKLVKAKVKLFHDYEIKPSKTVKL